LLCSFWRNTVAHLWRLKKPADYFDYRAKSCDALKEMKELQKKEHKENLIDQAALRAGQDWSFLSDKVVGAEDPPAT